MVLGRRMFEAWCYGGESFFVVIEKDNYKTYKDDGFIVCFVHDEKKWESRFLAMDAKSSNLDVVAIEKSKEWRWRRKTKKACMDTSRFGT